MQWRRNSTGTGRESSAALVEENSSIEEKRLSSPDAAPMRSHLENYQRFFENAVDGLFQTTPSGRYLGANPALARMYGYSSPEELVDVLTDIGEQLYVDPWRRQEFLSDVEKHGSVSNFEAQVYRRDGKIIWIAESAWAVCDSDGKVLFYEGIVRDITAQRTMADALRESETTWRCLVENSGDLILLVDKEGSILFSNRGGGANEESPNEPTSINDYLLKESKQSLRSVLNRTIESRTVTTFELEDVDSDENRWYESRAIPIEAEGEITSVLIIGTEITDQKRIEHSLRNSKRFIERVADSSPNILYVYDLSAHRYIYANRRLVKILGYTLEEVHEKGPRFLKRCVHPEDLPLLAERDRRLLKAEEGEVFECELRIQHRDGEWRWIHTRETVFTRTSDHRPLEIIGMAEDVTESKRIDHALRRSEARYRRLVEGTSIVPWERENARRFSFVGPQAAGLLGYPVEKWYQDHFWLDHVHPEDRSWVSQMWNEPPQAVHEFEVEYRMIAAGGRVIWVRDNVHVTRGDDGKWLSQGFMFEVTERIESREELKKSREQLRALSARLQSAREQERIANAREIHDELGGALTAIKIDLSLAQQRLDSVSNQEVVRKIESATALVDSAIGSVRRIATNLRPPVLDASGLVAAIEWQAAEFEKRCGIRCEFKSRWSTIVQDSALSTAIFRIFQEILTNVARHARASRVQVWMKEHEGNLTLTVKDNGRGITEGEQSTSLGVLGMRERATLFGGTVNIQGTAGRGTTVAVSIPLGEIAAKPAEAPNGAIILWKS